MQDARHLVNIVKGNAYAPSNTPISEDAEVKTILTVLEYADPRDLFSDNNAMRVRSRVRYLAALFPELTGNELVSKIGSIISNSNITQEDLRLILQGRRLNDPSKTTKEISLSIIQGIGRCLRDGMSIRQTAIEMRVAYETVVTIEDYLGIKKARDSKIMDDAVEAARYNSTVRGFAKKWDISRTKAHSLLIKGKNVLKELGEINE
jgi:hypothetical protein